MVLILLIFRVTNRFCYFHFISILLSLPHGEHIFLTNNGSRRCGKVHGFLRHGHRSLSDRVPVPVFASAAYHRACLCFARRFLSERAFRHTFPLGIVAKSTPDLSLSEGFIQLSKNRRKKIPSLYLPEKMAFSQKSDENFLFISVSPLTSIGEVIVFCHKTAI